MGKSFYTKHMPRKLKTEIEIPQWMECSWRRVPCGKKTCPICSRLSANLEKHLETGEDPDDVDVIFSDIAQSFKATLELIKRDAQARGISITNLDDIKTPPRPQKFSLYRQVADWHRQVFALTTSAEIGGDLWLATEAAADLLWYKNILLSKTYRQLCTRWERKHGAIYGETDIEYTAKVLNEVLGILKRSLAELSELDSSHKGGLFLALVGLQQLEKRILSI